MEFPSIGGKKNSSVSYMVTRQAYSPSARAEAAAAQVVNLNWNKEKKSCYRLSRYSRANPVDFEYLGPTCWGRMKPLEDI